MPRFSSKIPGFISYLILLLLTFTRRSAEDFRGSMFMLCSVYC